MQGLPLTANVRGCRCDSAWLIDAERLLARCVELVLAAGLQAVAQVAHTFSTTEHGPSGVTATVLLAESHLCAHTWSEQQGATLDVYVCNLGADHSAKAHALMAALLRLFDAATVEQHALQRGGLNVSIGP